MSPTKHKALLLVILLFMVMSLLTLLPYSSSKTNDLGYRSLCPFAPWSTLTLLVAAGLTHAIRNYAAMRGD